jgi:hypothetical protein
MNARLKNFFIFLILPLSISWAQDNGEVKIGVAAGIQSFPSAIDPYESNSRHSILYPVLDLNTQIIGKISLSSSLSRITCKGTLYGPLLCTQNFELYNFALGIEYNFGSQKREFKVGLQLLADFGEYGTEFFDEHYSAGLGIKIYGCAIQPVRNFLRLGIRTGIQRIHIQPYAEYDPINLDSFNIELLGYVPL